MAKYKNSQPKWRISFNSGSWRCHLATVSSKARGHTSHFHLTNLFETRNYGMQSNFCLNGKFIDSLCLSEKNPIPKNPMQALYINFQRTPGFRIYVLHHRHKGILYMQFITHRRFAHPFSSL